MEKALRSACCEADIVYLPGNEEGECASCGSPAFRFKAEGIELLDENLVMREPDFTNDQKLYLLGMQKACKDTLMTDISLLEL